MSLAFNILSNKWLADLLTNLRAALQALLLVVILGCLAVAWWRYQETIFVVSESKVEPRKQLSNDGDFSDNTVHPLTFYTDFADKRDIFHFVSVVSTGETAALQVFPVVSSDFAGRYVVQGIVYDHNPEVIIRDIQSNKTYFVHRNEQLEGATLIEIRENHVIFNRSGEMVELIKK